MKTLTTATALVALVAASSAFGQAQDQYQEPLVGEPPAASEPGAAPDALPEAMPSEPAPDTATEAESQDPPDEAVASGDQFITQQADDEMLASTLIGTSVENGAGESLGSINDIVLSEEGQANVIVIGVGGFLGIGQKNVGVPFDSIDKSTDADGNVTLILNASTEDLEAAPSFVTVNELRRQEEMEQAPAADPMAPAPPAEPLQ